jgi:ribose transport system ATP-binding protein
VSPPVLLAADGLCKSFGGTPVLRDVSFSLGAGRTLGLVGENGAGKSTLMNLLGGVLQPDAGRLTLAGEPYSPAGPHDAAARGVAFIHQELNLFPNLTIAENLCLGAFPARAGLFIDRGAMHERATAMLAAVEASLSPGTLVERLSPGERQLVEIARAVGASARLIIFDEPTTSLAAADRARLFALMDRLRRGGTTMIYISHALEDVLARSDDLLVLRDGQVVGRGPRAEFDEPKLIAAMVGRPLSQLYPPPSGAAPGDEVLRLTGVSEPGVIDDVSLTVRQREIVGLAGLMGSGRTELARIIFGLDGHARGDIRLKGEPLAGVPPQERIARGMAFVTEDRRLEGLCLEASVDANLELAALPRHARLAWIDTGRLGAAVSRVRAAVGVTPRRSRADRVGTLSGGNQQKVVLGRWLLTDPALLIVDEPTRGIDVGARHDIYVQLHALAAGGAAILVISSEIEELLGICDRILVMARGRVTASVTRDAFDRERLLGAAFAQPVTS